MSVPWYLMAKGKGGGGYKTASGPIVSVNDALAAPLRSLLVNIEPVQDLHGYDNPWPAGGGKNLYNKDGHDYSNGYIATEYLKSDGTQTQPTAGNWQTSEYIPIAGGLSYTISGLRTSDSHSPAMCYYDSSKSFISGMPYQNRAQITHQSPSNAAYVRLSIGPTATTQDSVQFEQSASKTPYAPYSNICPISGWSAVNVWVKPTYDPTANPTATIQLGQTVYGGTLDVTNGVLTVRPYYGSYNGEPLVGPWISSMDAYAPGATPTTGAQVVDLGGTPITIPLTPQEISTLQGQNNVWADSGDVTVEYLSSGGTDPDLMKLAVAFMGRK